jgi:hypothetical protein
MNIITTFGQTFIMAMWVRSVVLLQGGASGFPGAGDNDEGDVISVKIGIDLWNSSGLGLNTDTLRKAIISHAADYIAAQNREIRQGIKEENTTNVVITDNDYK